jgi:hypothetical protein
VVARVGYDQRAVGCGGDRERDVETRDVAATVGEAAAADERVDVVVAGNHAREAIMQIAHVVHAHVAEHEIARAQGDAAVREACECVPVEVTSSELLASRALPPEPER